ncbi:hypothetical protein ACQ4PT_034615 [Festuca glaucescens]
MSRWKENLSPPPPQFGGWSNPSPLLPCKRPLQSPCPQPRRALAEITGNALQKRVSGVGGICDGEGIDYGYMTPLPKVPKSCGFLVEDDGMDEAFLLEVDAICEEHSRSMAGKDKGRKMDSTVEREPAVVAEAIDPGPECLTLDDAFWKEANAVFEECNAQTAAKSHDEELKEMGEDESLVLSCGDDSLLPAISIADDGVKLEDAFWEVNAISKEHNATSSAKNQEVINEVDLEDGSVALCVDFPPVISIAEVGGEVVDAFLGEVDAICEGQATMSAAKDKEDPGEMGLEMEEDDGCAPRKYYEYLHSLNDRQREAACSDVAVPLMIVAGPGSGKTSTMVGRVLTLLKEGIPPSNILAMTFTTAAASEMRDRIAAVVGKAVAKEIIISTFHSFCLQLCRAHAEKLGRTSDFVLYGHGQQRRAIIEAERLLEHAKSDGLGDAVKQDDGDIKNSFKDKAKKWLKFVTQAKSSGKSPEEYEKKGDLAGASILRHYNEILVSCNALDYHDFINSSITLLTKFPEVYKECQETWQAIVVDEFQDTSAMQYFLLKLLASHNHITIVGDEDQSIFSFNGADVSGFDSFRRDFPNHKEVRLNKNYRSTRAIVEAATALIHNNTKRGHHKLAETDNPSGSKITVRECHSEDSQCAFVIDKIIETTSSSAEGCNFGKVAVLYRRQITGKAFQVSFRNRKIPFNVHGVAFYRKKVIKAIMAILRTTLPGCDDGPWRQAFKTLLPGDKEEKKKIIDHVEKISLARKCSFISAATDIFSAKVSGTFKRAQITQGRKVLSTLYSLSKFVEREQSVSAVISSVGNMLPQQYLLEKRAVIDNDGGKFLNEDNDIRSSKGLEWEVVFIVQANDSEIPLLHEYNGTVKEAGSTLEGEGVATKKHEQPSGDISFDHAEGETSIEKPRPIPEQNETSPYAELMQTCLANDFLKRFEIDDRAVVSHIFHQWAKKQAFQIPKRLLDKIKFVIYERLRGKGYKRKVT